MKKSKVNRAVRSICCLAGAFTLGAATAVHADSWSEASGLLAAAGMDPNETSFIKNNNRNYCYK